MPKPKRKQFRSFDVGFYEVLTPSQCITCRRVALAEIKALCARPSYLLTSASCLPCLPSCHPLKLSSFFTGEYWQVQLHRYDLQGSHIFLKIKLYVFSRPDSFKFTAPTWTSLNQGSRLINVTTLPSQFFCV